jgi:hypothetical protein
MAHYLEQTVPQASEISEAEVVGFIPRQYTSYEGRTANFGWIITPQREGPAPWQRRLSVQQAQLDALVAVPSWWRTVLLRTCVRFVRKPDVKALKASKWKPDDCRIDLLRLPGTAAEISSRLGFSVIKFPYVKAPSRAAETDTELVAGRAGHVLIEGGRLWRSTVVTLGSQKADRIEVLPDMTGIWAHFNCVEVPMVVVKSPEYPAPAQSTGQGHAVSNAEEITREVPIRVWTSEGSTDSNLTARVHVRPGAACPSEIPQPAPTATPQPTVTPGR